MLVTVVVSGTLAPVPVAVGAVVLTGAGRSAFDAATARAVAACVASTSLRPGCGAVGFRAGPGTKITDVRHALASGSAAEAAVDLSVTTPLQAVSYPPIEVSTSADCDGRSRGDIPLQQMGRVVVDLRAELTAVLSGVVVRWPGVTGHGG